MNTIGSDAGLALGTPVIIDATVVGRSEFQGGEASYLVEFDVRGRTVREWFDAEGVAVEPDGV